LLAVAAQLVRDVGALITGATQANRRLAMFALDGEVRFASAVDRAAFAEELTQAITALVAKYGSRHHFGNSRWGARRSMSSPKRERPFAIGRCASRSFAGDPGRGVRKRPGVGDGAGVTARAAVSSSGVKTILAEGVDDASVCCWSDGGDW
jgi:hypothetical protein